MRVGRPEGNQLNRLLRTCNQVVADFGLPMLYEKFQKQQGGVGGAGSKFGSASGSRKSHNDPAAAATRKGAANANKADRSECFHISIAWTLEDPEGEGSDRETTSDLSSLPGNDMEISFDVVKVKIGNVVHDIPLINSAAAAAAAATLTR